ncbi:hypothetical protein [Leptospira noguchii]|uniref:hypothetical protein n=1 Tax=Leptospira noguchii TaxID=28182 RepID=UPI000328654B|nr:hypothetical protein [Leptospira noguchii]EMS84042.1 hypothetical protein LEP1GSC073_2755 [Leptospira noguchii str. Cascata]
MKRISLILSFIIHMLLFECSSVTVEQEQVYLKQLELLEKGTLDTNYKKTASIKMNKTKVEKRISEFYLDLAKGYSSDHHIMCISDNGNTHIGPYKMYCQQEINTIKRGDNFNVQYVTRRARILYHINWSNESITISPNRATLASYHEDMEDDPVAMKYDIEQVIKASDALLYRLTEFLNKK